MVAQLKETTFRRIVLSLIKTNEPGGWKLSCALTGGANKIA
jgi:hypothetical protein